ncbi:DUF805 domain-containing protein [Flavobacterium album]|uniref:DUF805 domain-containing protein n=1 Tax=Flavobacterium album TaxID=2175091 RepID=A0A2S1QW40_9FLAO|nr:DUF805 domain-containing protein [Flavobacterium album]AWH84605.1 DUF805 domain-containing protein [Flavobacterium album]
MEWYLKVVRDNYANFSGRARRSEYWYFILFNLIFLIALYVLAMLIGTIGMALYGIYALATFVPGLAVAVRRLHDINKSGWYYFVVLIPIVGGIWLLVLLATEGDRGPNQYGPDPKNNYNEFDEIGAKETY